MIMSFERKTHRFNHHYHHKVFFVTNTVLKKIANVFIHQIILNNVDDDDCY